MRKLIHDPDAKASITFMVPEDMNSDLRERAWRERKSLSELLREYCEAGLRSRGEKGYYSLLAE